MAEKETRENKYEAGFSSDAKKEPVRVVFITKKTSAKVTGDVGPRVMTYPHLLIREAIAFMVLVIALVGVALFWDAPLEQIANPLLTPNPAKAPWYFLGLQELLHYFPPLVAGIIIPTLVVVALVIVPYFNVNIQGAPLWSENPRRTLWIFLAVMVALTCLLALFRAWTVLVPTEIIAMLALGSYHGTPSPNRSTVSWWLRERPLSWWVMTWFISVAVVLTLVGTFFRGPGWSWVWPWLPMSAEQMGQISRRLRVAFAVTSILFLFALAISPVRDLLSEWKHYKRAYVRFAQTRPDTKRLLADYRPQIDQIWIPDLGVVDRCTTCHQGITQASLLDPAVPQPFRSHPPIPHPVLQWGCTTCHRGQGAATEVTEAHETTLAWEQPLLPVHFIQASCGTCHRADLRETPQLDRGRALLIQLNCVGCHRLRDVERPEMLGPDLTNIGTKVSRQWIYEWLKQPRTVTDASGNVSVNGYETEETPRMPQFRLNEQELRDLSGYLSTLQSKPVGPYHFDPRVMAASKTDPADQGELRFRQMFCSTCHSLSVTRAGTTSLIGGDIGPELTKVGSKVNPAWLIAWLRDPQAYLPHSKMPRYQWSDADLYDVTQYISKRLTDPDLLAGVPSLGTPTADEIQQGRRLFVDKGCASCHLIAGMPSQRDLGPDLSAVGAKDVSHLSFGESHIPRNLIAYLQAKITDPLSVNPAARMPVYHLSSDDLDALTTALLSMTGAPATAGLQKLVLSQSQGSFHPAGEFGRVYERYKCYVCHQFNGFGGTLAPDLSYEGSRAQRQWLIEFLKDPKTVRPTLVLRMPQFNMTDQEAATLAVYIGTALNSPDVNPSAIETNQFTAEKAALGKQLYEVKYECQSCHTIGATGGYVGPNLNNAGNWLAPAWIEAWLRNPQTLVPDTIEPRRAFSEDEIQALTAYLLTLRASSKPQGSAQVARIVEKSSTGESLP